MQFLQRRRRWIQPRRLAEGLATTASLLCIGIDDFESSTHEAVNEIKCDAGQLLAVFIMYCNRNAIATDELPAIIFGLRLNLEIIHET